MTVWHSGCPASVSGHSHEGVKHAGLGAAQHLGLQLHHGLLLLAEGEAGVLLVGPGQQGLGHHRLVVGVNRVTHQLSRGRGAAHLGQTLKLLWYKQ